MKLLDYPLVFLHIPKTAGTTLHKVISHQYRPSQTIIQHDSDNVSADDTLKRLGGRGGLVMGHLSARFHQNNSSVRYLTCLRQPVARLRSHYEHAKNDPSHYLHKLAISSSLGEYAQSGASGELSNGMVRMLSGIDDFHAADIDESTLDRAKEVLETRVVLPCLTEEFDQSLLLLADKLGWRRPFYLSRKRGKYREYVVAPEDRTAIERMNALDSQLFEFARGLLDQQLGSLHGSLDRRLSSFKWANRSIGRPLFLCRELRRRASQWLGHSPA